MLFTKPNLIIFHKDRGPFVLLLIDGDRMLVGARL